MLETQVDHCTKVFLPNKGGVTLVSAFNRLGDKTFYHDDIVFEYDPVTQTANASDSGTTAPSNQTSVDIRELQSAVSNYVTQHYPSDAVSGVFAQQNSSSEIAIVLADNKFSPNNYWNGRWLAHFLIDTSSNQISGKISLDVHYYEDGNVRLKTSKDVSNEQVSSPLSAQSIVKKIAAIEQDYQVQVNKAFINLNEGPFKALRRQLPVTRSKMNWHKPLALNPMHGKEDEQQEN